MVFLINITRGIVVNVIFHTLLLVVVVTGDYVVDTKLFSLFLIIVLFFTGVGVGRRAKRFGGFSGLIVGISTGAIFLLYLSQFQGLDQVTNIFLISIYGVVSYISAFLSSFWKKRADNKKKK